MALPLLWGPFMEALYGFITAMEAIYASITAMGPVFGFITGMGAIYGIFTAIGDHRFFFYQRPKISLGDPPCCRLIPSLLESDVNHKSSHSCNQMS